MLYSFMMIEHPQWKNWAQTLQQKKLTGIAITLLEGSGPMKMFLSQIMLSISPLINQGSDSQWHSFARMLEDPQESKFFMDYLLEEKRF